MMVNVLSPAREATMQPVPTPHPAVVYGSTDAAKMLRVSVGYIHRLIELGVARPTVPMGSSGRLIFSLDDLRRLGAAIGRDLDHGGEGAG